MAPSTAGAEALEVDSTEEPGCGRALGHRSVGSKARWVDGTSDRRALGANAPGRQSAADRGCRGTQDRWCRRTMEPRGKRAKVLRATRSIAAGEGRGAGLIRWLLFLDGQDIPEEYRKPLGSVSPEQGREPGKFLAQAARFRSLERNP
jgi:hypothetical protein